MTKIFLVFCLLMSSMPLQAMETPAQKFAEENQGFSKLKEKIKKEKKVIALHYNTMHMAPDPTTKMNFLEKTMHYTIENFAQLPAIILQQLALGSLQLAFNKLMGNDRVQQQTLTIAMQSKQIEQQIKLTHLQLQLKKDKREEMEAMLKQVKLFQSLGKTEAAETLLLNITIHQQQQNAIEKMQQLQELGKHKEAELVADNFNQFLTNMSQSIPTNITSNEGSGQPLLAN